MSICKHHYVSKGAKLLRISLQSHPSTQATVWVWAEHIYKSSCTSTAVAFDWMSPPSLLSNKLQTSQVTLKIGYIYGLIFNSSKGKTWYVKVKGWWCDCSSTFCSKELKEVGCWFGCEGPEGGINLLTFTDSLHWHSFSLVSQSRTRDFNHSRNMWVGDKHDAVRCRLYRI